LTSQKLFGIGERTTDFVLKEGTYVIYSADNSFTYDDG